MKPRAIPLVVALPLVAAVLTLVGSCSPSQSCDTAQFLRCYGGVVHVSGCVPDMIVAQCANGCIEEGMTGGYNTCPSTLCRHDAKKAGDACQTAADCLPTPAIWSSTEVTNTYLTCDVGTQTCVATDPPMVADWLAPCSPDLVARILTAQIKADGGAYEFDAVVSDPGCAEGLCALHRDAGGSCIANACTRACTGDHECPRGSACQGAVPTGCTPSNTAYCRPGGPAGIGFDCE